MEKSSFLLGGIAFGPKGQHWIIFSNFFKPSIVLTAFLFLLFCATQLDYVPLRYTQEPIAIFAVFFSSVSYIYIVSISR